MLYRITLHNYTQEAFTNMIVEAGWNLHGTDAKDPQVEIWTKQDGVIMIVPDKYSDYMSRMEEAMLNFFCTEGQPVLTTFVKERNEAIAVIDYYFKESNERSV